MTLVKPSKRVLLETVRERLGFSKIRALLLSLIYIVVFWFHINGKKIVLRLFFPGGVLTTLRTSTIGKGPK